MSELRIEKKAKEVLTKRVSDMLNNKNRVAKAIAAYIRNQIENFHVRYVSDNQMRNINPLIRNAIYTFLCDYGNEYTSIATLSNEKLCGEYIFKNTLTYLQEQKIPAQGIKEFKTLIMNSVGIPLKDLSKGCVILVGYELIYVPDYWEDCVYCNNLR